MMWGVPSYSAQDRAALLQNVPSPGAKEDGSDVLEEWRRLLERRGPGTPVSALTDELGDRLRAGASGVKLLRADSGFWNVKVFQRLEESQVVDEIVEAGFPEEAEKQATVLLTLNPNEPSRTVFDWLLYDLMS